MANRGSSYRSRDLSGYKAGVIPHSSRQISPITANRHKYELKPRLWSKKSAESWFESHSPSDRQAVYSFLDTLHTADQRTKASPTSKVGLAEMVNSLERYRPVSSKEEKSVVPSLPEVPRPSTSVGRRYLSQTWRVTNPRDDVETNVRPDHNASSFFNYTKKSQPEYYFIHPQWY